MDKLDPNLIQACLVCGKKDARFEGLRLEGRQSDVWRVICCSCGQTVLQWSVSQGAAVRAWNRNLAYADPLPGADKMHSGNA